MTNNREQANVIVDSLRMSERDLMRLLAQIVARDGARTETNNARRADLERAITESTGLPRTLVRICHPRGNCTTYLVKPRDIHTDGFVFLHGAFVHLGAECSMLVRARAGQPTQLSAKVIDCRHVSGRVHEVVASFDQPIRLEDYMLGDQEADDRCTMFRGFQGPSAAGV